jgi:hypothetical protein
MPELLHQRIKLTVLLEDQDGGEGVDAVVGGVPKLGLVFEPVASRLPVFLHAPSQVLDGGGAFASAFKILDEGSAHLLPLVDVVAGEIVDPRACGPVQHQRQVACGYQL